MRKSDQPGLEDMFCGDVCTATVQRGMIEAWEVGRTRLKLRGSWRRSDKRWPLMEMKAGLIVYCCRRLGRMDNTNITTTRVKGIGICY